MTDPAALLTGTSLSSRRPLVSVVIPAYNAQKFIAQALNSVLSQGYPEIEILVVDDGSKDATVAVVRREAPLAKVIQQTNAGAAAARNIGLQHATGEFICFLDADDGWFAGKLVAQVDYLVQHPDVGVVFHNWFVWRPTAEGAYAPPPRPAEPRSGHLDASSSGWIYHKLLMDCIVHTSTVMMRREVLQRVGYFERGLVTGEDYDYWLRVSRIYPMHKLDATYSFYRETAGSLTSAPKRHNNEYDVLQKALRQWGLSSPQGPAVPRALIQGRLAQLAFDFGYLHFHQGSPKLARASFVASLGHQPLRWRAWLYVLAATFKQWMRPSVST